MTRAHQAKACGRRSILLPALAAFVLVLSACTTIGHKPAPDDWPRLRHVDVRLDNVGLIAKCYAVVPLWMKALGGISFGCAWINFADMTCTTYTHLEASDDEPTRAHELDHCRGRDHFGSSDLADLWRAWRDHQLRGGEAFVYVRADGAVVTYRGER